MSIYLDNVRTAQAELWVVVVMADVVAIKPTPVALAPRRGGDAHRQIPHSIDGDEVLVDEHCVSKVY